MPHLGKNCWGRKCLKQNWHRREGDPLNSSQEIVLPLIPSCIHTETVFIPADLAKPSMDSQVLAERRQEINEEIFVPFVEWCCFNPYQEQEKKKAKPLKISAWISMGLIQSLLEPGENCPNIQRDWNESQLCRRIPGQIKWGVPWVSRQAQAWATEGQTQDSFCSNCSPKQEQTQLPQAHSARSHPCRRFLGFFVVFLL